jgi:hypothetical protein
VQIYIGDDESKAWQSTCGDFFRRPGVVVAWYNLHILSRFFSFLCVWCLKFWPHLCAGYFHLFPEPKFTFVLTCVLKSIYLFPKQTLRLVLNPPIICQNTSQAKPKRAFEMLRHVCEKICELINIVFREVSCKCRHLIIKKHLDAFDLAVHLLLSRHKRPASILDLL